MVTATSAEINSFGGCINPRAPPLAPEEEFEAGVSIGLPSRMSSQISKIPCTLSLHSEQRRPRCNKFDFLGPGLPPDVKCLEIGHFLENVETRFSLSASRP